MGILVLSLNDNHVAKTTAAVELAQILEKEGYELQLESVNKSKLGNGQGYVIYAPDGQPVCEVNPELDVIGLVEQADNTYSVAWDAHVAAQKEVSRLESAKFDKFSRALIVAIAPSLEEKVLADYPDVDTSDAAIEAAKAAIDQTYAALRIAYDNREEARKQYAKWYCPWRLHN